MELFVLLPILYTISMPVSNGAIIVSLTELGRRKLRVQQEKKNYRICINLHGYVAIVKLLCLLRFKPLICLLFQQVIKVYRFCAEVIRNCTLCIKCAYQVLQGWGDQGAGRDRWASQSPVEGRDQRQGDGMRLRFKKGDGEKDHEAGGRGFQR